MDPVDIQPRYVLVPDLTAAPGRALRSKPYARWNLSDTRAFIAACETAIAESHRNEKCFTKHKWKRIDALFNSVTGHNWSKQQLRNHWDAMCRTYKRLFELVAQEEWWSRKIKENKDFKDKDVSEIYTHYRQLFGDSFDANKYAVTPTKLCRTGFNLFEDSVLEDHRDAIPVDVEGSGSSDEAVKVQGNSGLKAFGNTSGRKIKSYSGPRRERQCGCRLRG